MDVRAKQQLCIALAVKLGGLEVVSPHVISDVGRLRVECSDEI